jgi:hypothetical protein
LGIDARKQTFANPTSTKRSINMKSGIWSQTALVQAKADFEDGGMPRRNWSEKYDRIPIFVSLGHRYVH